MIGKTISHYHIIEQLGAGGMGVVYKAHDTKLDRTVALKFLPSQITVNNTDKERFLQEAKAAAALNHPNVCVIHDIQEYEGQQFIIMEYIEGKTLRQLLSDEGQLTIETAIEYTIQIGEALQEAHNKGIVHRDVKSDNIMVTTTNQVKVMDFGLAKLKGSLKLTKSSSTVGTLAYMAPEQIQGGEVDARSDIFSFGVVLYEMLTGQCPFKGDYEASIIYSILNDEPEPIQKLVPDVSSELLHIINRALEKDAENRYQSIKDMLIDLRRLKRDSNRVSRESLKEMSATKPETFGKFKSKGKKMWLSISVAAVLLILIVWSTNQWIFQDQQEIAANSDNSIAVMYFENNTNDEQMKWFSRGLPHMLITDLESSKNIHVLGYQKMYDLLKSIGKHESDIIDKSTASEIARKAGIFNILYGSVFKFGEEIRIDFKLENVKDGRIILADKVSGENVLDLANKIGYRINTLFKSENDANKSEFVSSMFTSNLDAYKTFFRGEEHLNKYEWIKARQEFEKAIAIDTTFPLAYYKYAVALWWENENVGQEYFDALINALKFRDKLPEMYIHLSQALLKRSQEGFAKTTVLFEKIKNKYPDSKEALYQLSENYYHTREYDKAINIMERILELDPQYSLGLAHLTDTYFRVGNYEKALEEGKRRLKNYPGDAKAHLVLGDCNVIFGRVQEGFAHYDSAFAFWYDREILFDEHPLAHKAGANLYLGRYDQAKKDYQRLTEISKKLTNLEGTVHWIHLAIGHIYEIQNDFKSALQEYEKAKKYGSYLRIYRDLGAWYARMGKISQAQVLADTIINRLKGEPNRYYFHVAGEIGLAKNDYNTAINYFKKSNPMHLYRYPLVKTYIKMGEIDMAIKELKELTRLIIPRTGVLNNDYFTLYYPYCIYTLATLYENTGQIDQAIQTYEKFLKLWKYADDDIPELIDAKKRLANLSEGS